MQEVTVMRYWLLVLMLGGCALNTIPDPPGTSPALRAAARSSVRLTGYSEETNPSSRAQVATTS
jgi:hypothetical protein